VAVDDLLHAKARRLAQVLARTPRALSDPALQIGFRLPDRHGFVDAAGDQLRLPRKGRPGRQTTVERGGFPVAAIVHDPAVLDDPTLT